MAKKTAPKSKKPAVAKKAARKIAPVQSTPKKNQKTVQTPAAKSVGKPAPKSKSKPMTDSKHKPSNEQRIKSVMKKLSGGKNTPPIFKIPSKRHTPIAFSLSDVRDLIKEKGKSDPTHAPIPAVAKRAALVEAKVEKPRVLKSATLDDLLGATTAKKPTFIDQDESKVPEKWLGYYKKLKAMRERLILSVEERSEQTLKASSKESSGDLSSYGQHMADAGTDASDYDFALNLVSSDQEMLREVEGALNRIAKGTFGLCEVTGKPISRDRLNAVPFTRFSKEGQDQYEKTRRRTAQRVGIASGEDDDDAAAGSSADDEHEET